MRDKQCFGFGFQPYNKGFVTQQCRCIRLAKSTATSGNDGGGATKQNLDLAIFHFTEFGLACKIKNIGNCHTSGAFDGGIAIGKGYLNMAARLRPTIDLPQPIKPTRAIGRVIGGPA
jgi:hypothetical protein